MNTNFITKLIFCLCCTMNCTFAQAQNNYYINSNVFGYEPWGSSSNIVAMDAVFGAGGWTQDYFETCDVATVFSDSSCFVFLEGSDFMADELESFFTAYHSIIQSWVNGGGNLFLNAAPNEGDGMNFGFGGVVLTYWGGSSSALSLDPAHPIFNGPFLPVGTSWTGSSFSHASISGGGITNLIVDSDDPSIVALAEKSWGSGTVLFGGMTTNNFHYPTVEAASLRANILAYLACGPIPCTPTVPTGLFADNITSTTVKLNWDAMPGVDKYEVRVFTMAGALVVKKKPVANFKFIGGLLPGTDYLFKVRSICIDEETFSAFSSPSYFTTLLRTGEIMPNTALFIYPNPGNGVFNLQLEGNINEEVQIVVSDINGQIIYNHTVYLPAEDFKYQIQLDNCAAGVYGIKVMSQNNVLTDKIIIQ